LRILSTSALDSLVLPDHLVKGCEQSSRCPHYHYWARPCTQAVAISAIPSW
jgi:hypothetical protein